MNKILKLFYLQNWIFLKKRIPLNFLKKISKGKIFGSQNQKKKLNLKNKCLKLPERIGALVGKLERVRIDWLLIILFKTFILLWSNELVAFIKTFWLAKPVKIKLEKNLSTNTNYLLTI